ncbi:MAG: class I SAM-dependent methyltransferase [Bacteroidales bacterium]
MNLLKGALYKRKYFKGLSQISEYRNIDGWLTDNEAYGLYNLATKLPLNSTLVEIGSWKGKSTFCLAKGLRKGKIYAIDPFNAEGEPGSKEIYAQNRGEIPLLEQFSTEMTRLGVSEKIEPLQGYSSQFVNKFTTIDFLFIDGDHSIEGCDFDFTHFSPFVRRGGYIAFHDFYPDRDELGPTWVIKNRVLLDNRYGFFRKYDSLWIAKKTGE